MSLVDFCRKNSALPSFLNWRGAVAVCGDVVMLQSFRQSWYSTHTQKHYQTLRVQIRFRFYPPVYYLDAFVSSLSMFLSYYQAIRLSRPQWNGKEWIDLDDIPNLDDIPF